MLRLAGLQLMRSVGSLSWLIWVVWVVRVLLGLVVWWWILIWGCCLSGLIGGWGGFRGRLVGGLWSGLGWWTGVS
jgi:hypothetical protein